MTCEELRDDMPLYALGISDGEGRTEIEEHLGRGCPTCTAEMKRALEMNAGLLALAPDVAPARKLRSRVLTSVGAQESNWAWISGWSAILAGLLVAVLWLSLQDRRRIAELADARRQVQRSTMELTRVQRALAMLNEPETRQVIFGQPQARPPKGRVFVHRDRGVLLIADNLPSLGPGKTYELWVIPKGGAPRPSGLFQSDASGNALFLAPGPVDTATLGAVAVSVEPEGGSSSPTTTPVIVAPVAD